MSHIVPFRYHTGRGTYSVFVCLFVFVFLFVFLLLFFFFVFFQFELMLKGKLHFIYFPGTESDDFAFFLSKFTFSGFMPNRIETAKAIANNPQSLPSI